KAMFHEISGIGGSRQLDARNPPFRFVQSASDAGSGPVSEGPHAIIGAAQTPAQKGDKKAGCPPSPAPDVRFETPRRFRWPPIPPRALVLRPPSARCAASKSGLSAGCPARWPLR